jgi:hypothetical protein
MTSTKRRQSFSLRLSPQAREQAIQLAKREGISLNHFISLALAEKISRAEQEEIQQNTAPAPAPVRAKRRISGE